MANALDQLGNTATLYSLPGVYYRLRGVLDNPNYSMADVVAAISSDPGMTARILKLANSAFYGFTVEVHTVSHAIGMIGTRQLQDMVLATSTTKTFEGISSELMNMGTFWYRSVYCGVVARLLASRCGLFDSEQLFVTGLLSDIGHLVMYQQLPELSQQSIVRSREEGVALYKVEREIFGFDYAQAGGELTRQWRLPRILQCSIKYHLKPTESEGYALLASIVHIARALSMADQENENVEIQDLQVKPEVWELLGLIPEESGVLCEGVEEQVGEIFSLMFPKTKIARGGTH